MIGLSIGVTRSGMRRLPGSLGPELIPDGSFDTGIVGWQPGLTSVLAHENGRLKITNPGGAGKYPKAQRSLGVLTAGIAYRLAVGESVRVSGNQHRVGIASVSSAQNDALPADVLIFSNTSIEESAADFVPLVTQVHFLFLFAQDAHGATEVHYDNVSLREVFG